MDLNEKEFFNGELEEVLVKFIVVGSSVVGKSSLVNVYARKKEFSSEIQTTVGIEFAPVIYKKGNIILKVGLMDTAG